jgi:hypothetical protein
LTVGTGVGSPNQNSIPGEGLGALVIIMADVGVGMGVGVNSSPMGAKTRKPLGSGALFIFFICCPSWATTI